MALTHGVTHWDPDNCTGCRYKTVQVAATPAMQPHFNHAVGDYVTSDRDFREALKRAGERNSLATGMNHEYEPRYPGDLPEPPHREADGVLDTRARNLMEGIR